MTDTPTTETDIMDHITKRLIRENADAPADRLIRAIYATCSGFEAPEEGDPIPNVESALALWYGVDDLMLEFTLPNGNVSFVKLIHQHRHSRPHIEDISDYGTLCDDVPELVQAMLDSNYRLIYTD